MPQYALKIQIVFHSVKTPESVGALAKGVDVAACSGAGEVGVPLAASA